MTDHVETVRALTEQLPDAETLKHALADLLDADRRRVFLDHGAVIEKGHTAACTATADPCLESGCALEDETCLQPLLRAATEYRETCGAEWLKLARSEER